jgi:rhodanese-related sulfurtransferase
MSRPLSLTLISLLVATLLAGCAVVARTAPTPTAAPAQADGYQAALAVPLNGKGYRDLNVAQFSALLAATPDVVLVNTHIPYEGHLPNTDLEIPYNDLPALLSALPADRETPIALYCRSGSMSDSAATALAQEGYTRLFELDGGMIAWRAAGLELLTTR